MELEDVRALVKELISLMQANKLSEISLELEGLKIGLRKGEGGKVEVERHNMKLEGASRPGAPYAGSVASEGLEQKAPAQEIAPSGEEKYLNIVSPMVGTFYGAPAPDADPFVEEGDEVDEETVVCIIEAMKVMNEIRAEVSGRIVQSLVSNGEAVEFGQPLFLVEPRPG
ncbi:MAG: hypothetical protein AMS15_05955 [Planctomycetes bacterium DG_23]|nr:MAG: hypothetical protein AMS15_05955 [Planctomycetes bacterium DG_23]